MRLLPRPSHHDARAGRAHGVRRPPVPGRPPAWQRRWRRHRNAVAAILAGVGVWSLATDLHPPTPETRLVATARHDLSPGSTVTAEDLVVAARPVASLATDSVATAGAVTGRVVAFPVLEGEVVRERDVVAGTLLDSLGADVVATPVRLSDDATLASVRPGDLVDVVAARPADESNPARAEVVAARVRVLTVGTPTAATGSGGLLGSSSTASAPVLVLATTAEQSLDIAAAVVGSRLSVTLRAG